MDLANDLLVQRFRVGDFLIDPRRNAISSLDVHEQVEPKVMDVLMVLAKCNGEVVRRDALVDAVWGAEAGGDESLTRAISLLRKAFAAAPGGSGYIETVRKRGYRLTVSVTIPANGSAAEPGAEPLQATPAQERKFPPAWRRPVLAALAVIILIGGAVFVSIGQEPRSLRYDEVAIGEIAPIAGDPQSEKAAAALRESLLRELALGGVETVPASDTHEAGILLTGAFAPSGETSAVNIRVEDAASGRTLWSRQFELGDAPQRAVRHYVPWRVADEISCGVVGNDMLGPTRDAKLVGYFIMGCHGFRTRGGFEPLLQYARKALTHAPDSVLAQVRYAIAAAWTAGAAQAGSDRDALLRDARARAEKVMENHPEVGQAYYAHGVADWFAMDWAAAEENLRKALELDPGYPFTYNALSNVLRETGRRREAFDIQRRAVAADHFSLKQPMFLAMMLADQGRLAEAYFQIEQVSWIDEQTGCSFKHQITFWWDDPHAALKDLDTECVRSLLSPAQVACSRAFLAARVDEADPRQAMKLCDETYFFDPVRMAAMLGFTDEAIQIALTLEVNPNDALILFYADTAPLRRDPRFMMIAARYHLTETWLKTNRWPDFCSDPDLPYDCRQAAEQAESMSVAGK